MKDQYDIRKEIDATYELMDEGDDVEKEKINALEWVIGQMDPPTDGIKGTGKLATEDEVKKCIELLRRERKEIPEYSFFGDSNWKTIDAQIEVLEWALS